jgi:hypothetical protein
VIQKYNHIFERIKRINLHPNAEWDHILAEPESTGRYLKQLVFPAIFGVTVITWLGYFFLAITVGNFSIWYSFLKAISVFCELFFSFYVSSLLVFEICPRLKINITYEQLFRLFSYSLTGFWIGSAVAGILANYPTLGKFIKFLGIYGIYVFIIGSEKMQIGNRQLRNRLLWVSLAAVIITYLLINWSFGFALQSMHYAFIFNQE